MNKLKFTIRDATPEDAKYTSLIGIKGWKYAYTGIFSDERLKDNQIRKSSPESIKRVEEFIGNGIGIKLVAVDMDGKVLGFKFNTPDEDGEWRGGGTYIDPDYIGMGIGRALFIEFARRISALGKEKFWVNCATENKSMEFYKKLGGKTIKQSNEEKYENQSISQLEFNVKDLIR